jgi:hypothetical protein
LVQIDVEVAKDVDNDWMKREPKPANSRSRKMTTSFSWGFGTVSLPGALVVPTMRFF